MSWIYLHDNGGPFTVGHYNPAGQFVPAIDCRTEKHALKLIHYLNGGGHEDPPGEIR